MRNNISDLAAAVALIAYDAAKGTRTDAMRAAIQAAEPHLYPFTYTEEDLQSLARGVVPEWLRFDADATLDEELAK
jgi:hypothetical protein